MFGRQRVCDIVQNYTSGTTSHVTHVVNNFYIPYHFNDVTFLLESDWSDTQEEPGAACRR